VAKPLTYRTHDTNHQLPQNLFTIDLAMIPFNAVETPSPHQKPLYAFMVSKGPV
jgi:hypothetical protein